MGFAIQRGEFLVGIYCDSVWYLDLDFITLHILQDPLEICPKAGLARPTNLQAAGGSKNSLCRPPSEDFGY